VDSVALAAVANIKPAPSLSVNLYPSLSVLLINFLGTFSKCFWRLEMEPQGE